MILLLRFFLLAFIVYLVVRWLSRLLSSVTEQNSGVHSSALPKQPYEILGIAPNASQKEIKEAYKKALAEYHPDKVMHLGKDLQKLAKERSNEIIAAYEVLKK